MSCFVFHLCARNKDIVDSASDTGSCVKEYGKSKFSKEVTRRINERKSEIGKIHDKRDTEAIYNQDQVFL